MPFTDYATALAAVEAEIGSIDTITKEFFDNFHQLSETADTAIKVFDLPLSSDVVLNFEGNALIPSNLTLAQLNNVFGLLNQTVTSVTALRDTFDDPSTGGQNIVDIVTAVASGQIGTIAGVAVTGFATVTLGLPALGAIAIGGAVGLGVTLIADAAFDDAAEHLNLANIINGFTTGVGTAAAWAVTTLADGFAWLDSAAEAIGDALYDVLVNDLLATFFDFLAGEPDFEGGGVLSLGQTYTGTIDGSFDEDWFAIDLVAGQDIRITQQMVDPFYNSELKLYDGAGNLFADENEALSDSDTGIIEGTVLTSGRYYIVTDGSADRQYTISATSVTLPATITELADAPYTSSTPYQISMGETFLGTVSDYNGDWIAVDLVAGQEIRITQQMVDPFYNSTLQLYDATGVLFADENEALSDSDTGIIQGTVLTSGRYYIDASGTLGRQYTVSLDTVSLPDTITELADAPHTSATPYQLEFGETFKGVVSDYNGDWIAVDLVAGQEIRITQQMDDPFYNASLTLYDVTGAVFANENPVLSSTHTHVIEGTVTASGRYYIGAGGSSDQQYTVSFDNVSLPDTLTELTDAPNTSATPYLMALGDTFKGVVSDYNGDWIAVDLVAGQDIRITQQMVDPFYNSTLQLYDVTGALLTNENVTLSDNDTGIIEGTILTTGRYYIDAGGSYNREYTVSLEAINLPETIAELGDAPNNSSTPYQIGLGDSFAGYLESYTGDWIAIDLTAGQTVRLTQQMDDPFYNSTLRLYDVTGTLFAEENATLSDNDTAIVDAVIATSGRYYIAANGSTAQGYVVSADLTSQQGTGTADVLPGTGFDDLLYGLGGNDSLMGGAGNDTLIGGNGKDSIEGGDDDDLLNGGLGADTLHGGSGNDDINAGDSNDLVTGGIGDDLLKGQYQQDTLSGGVGNDTLNGADGGDVLNGGNDDDLLQGGIGSDTLNGGDGNDFLRGQNQRDTLNGGAGDDTLEGGQGGEVFVFANGFGNDIITDFNASNAEDIDLSAVTAITGFNDLMNNHLSFGGSGNAVITVGSNSITLQGVTASDIGVGLAYSEDDFIF